MNNRSNKLIPIVAVGLVALAGVGLMRLKFNTAPASSGPAPLTQPSDPVVNKLEQALATQPSLMVVRYQLG